MKYAPIALLAAVLLLGYCYGNERARNAELVTKERALRVQIDSQRSRRIELASAYSLAIQRADSLSRRVPVYRERRGRAAASTDSAVARVDSVLPALPDSIGQAYAELRRAVLSERLSADSLVSSLESTVSALRVSIAAADSVIASQSRELSSYASLVQVLEREAHPPFWVRAGRVARSAAIGAAAALVWVAVR